MNIRDALINQAPSLAGWREAQAEIARLDNELQLMTNALWQACNCDGALAIQYIELEKEKQ